MDGCGGWPASAECHDARHTDSADPSKVRTALCDHTALRGEGLVHTGHAGDLNSKEVQGCGANTAMRYDAFGDNRTSFRELERKTPIFYGREVQKISNASY